LFIALAGADLEKDYGVLRKNERGSILFMPISLAQY
jgi:hypothetical protein